MLPRILSTVISGFIALTAIPGGLALLMGMEASRFPIEWLYGTPFEDYTVPALLLAIVAGGSSLAACLATSTRRKKAPYVTMFAGLAMMAYIFGEYLLLKQVPPGPTVIEMVYFGLGLALLALGAYRKTTE